MEFAPSFHIREADISQAKPIESEIPAEAGVKFTLGRE